MTVSHRGMRSSSPSKSSSTHQRLPEGDEGGTSSEALIRRVYKELPRKVRKRVAAFRHTRARIRWAKAIVKILLLRTLRIRWSRPGALVNSQRSPYLWVMCILWCFQSKDLFEPIRWSCTRSLLSGIRPSRVELTGAYRTLLRAPEPEPQSDERPRQRRRLQE